MELLCKIIYLAAAALSFSGLLCLYLHDKRNTCRANSAVAIVADQKRMAECSLCDNRVGVLDSNLYRHLPSSETAFYSDRWINWQECCCVFEEFELLPLKTTDVKEKPGNFAGSDREEASLSAQLPVRPAPRSAWFQTVSPVTPHIL